jgi:predicted SAM-dependent methyltransferase
MLINLGSGQRKFGAGWTNIDIQEKWSPDIVADGAHLDMIPNESAEMVVLHHVLEHFGLGEADQMLKECWRVLAPGGSLIVCVPDLKALVKRWVLGQITDYIFLVNLMGAYMGDEADRHRWHYTRQTLEETIRKAGEWSRVESFNYRPIEGADISKDWWILSIEAVK